MSLEADYLEAFEVDSPEQIRAALVAGASATERIKGKLRAPNVPNRYLAPAL